MIPSQRQKCPNYNIKESASKQILRLMAFIT